MDNVTRLMEEALMLPDRAMTYMVSRRLAELHPGQSVVTVTCGFDAEGFARYGNADAKLASRMAQQEIACWDEGTCGPKRRLLTAWIEIEWQGATYHVLQAPRLERGRAHWVVGPEESLNRFLQAVFAYSRQRSPETHIYTGWWRDNDGLDREIERARWDELVLPAEIESLLRMHTRGFFEARAEFEQLGVPWKRGLLLTGPPGNGKTHVIRAILNTLTVPRVLIKSFGDDADDVQEVFAKVRELSPCVLVLEDLDSLIKPALLSTILNSLDGAEPLNGVLVLATTNHPEKLDPAIRDRPSRFDRVIEFGPPAPEERRELLRRLLSRGPKPMRLSSRQLDALARITEGFSYAYLKELAICSSVVWSRDKRPGSMTTITKKLVSELRSQIETATQPGEAEPD